jgi:hypothetical protein
MFRARAIPVPRARDPFDQGVHHREVLEAAPDHQADGVFVVRRG